MTDPIARLRRRLAALERVQAEALSYSDEARAAILDARARALAKPAQAAPTVAAEDAVAFDLGRERYALPIRWVIEVSRGAPITRLPGVPRFVLGVCHFRGEILAVMDPWPLFGLTPDEPPSSPRLLVLGQDRAELALRLDGALALTQVPQGELPGIARGDSVADKYVRGVTPDATIVIDGAALLGDRRLYVDVSADTDARGA